MLSDGKTHARLHRPSLLLFGMACLLTACGGDSGSSSPTPTPIPPPPTVKVAFDFTDGIGDWRADYADYTQGQEASIGFQAGHGAVPTELAGTKGFRLMGRNVSDDIFMYISRPVTGLQPGRQYRVEVDVRIATREAPGCIGAGGSPGEAVLVKTGASPDLPGPRLEGIQVRTNFDKGEQQLTGTHAVAIGHIAQTQAGSCVLENPFRLKSLSSEARSPVVTADAQGRLWPLIGFDSGYEGITIVYLLGGEVRLVPQ